MQVVSLNEVYRNNLQAEIDVLNVTYGLCALVQEIPIRWEVYQQTYVKAYLWHMLYTMWYPKVLSSEENMNYFLYTFQVLYHLKGSTSNLHLLPLLTISYHYKTLFRGMFIYIWNSYLCRYLTLWSLNLNFITWIHGPKSFLLTIFFIPILTICIRKNGSMRGGGALGAGLQILVGKPCD